MTRVPFGVSSSPFLLAATIKHHIRKYRAENEKVYNMLNESLYVDDLFSGTDSVEEAFSLTKDTIRIMNDAGMNMRKWKTNSKQLREKWEREKISMDVKDDSIPIKILGIIWNIEDDTINLENAFLSEALNENAKNTKRSVLKLAAKVFDPAGLISPFMIRVKCLLQELWQSGLDWDDELTEDLKGKWIAWISEINDLQDVTLNRRYFLSRSRCTNLQIHTFCDATPKAYGAVSYFRYTKEDGTIATSFIMSKAKVAPLKILTLPRLELMGAVIASRITHYLKNLFDVKNEDLFYWSDSTITLHWIQGSAAKWKPFVSNRVTEIQAISDPLNWKHCRGKENPADMISRGCTVEILQNSSKWWHGPTWLCLPAEEWPVGGKLTLDLNHDEDMTLERKKIKPEIIVCHSSENIYENEFMAEERNNQETTLVNVTNAEDQIFHVLTKFSSWTKLQRVVAWCMRFTANCKLASNRKKGYITVDEMKRASEIILKVIQRNEFYQEIKCLEAGKPIKSHSKLISLNPFLDKNNVMRVGGRLNNAEIPEAHKHPIIIPNKNYVTKLIIEYYHLKHLHGGAQLLLSAIRQNYWIINARTEIKKCIWKCVRCAKSRATTATQLMGDLPSNRVIPGRVFSKIGVDLAGPFHIKSRRGRGGKVFKCYVCVFICFTTKATHLELVSDLSTEAFIASLKRFVARRGKPQEIHSDNGTNFVGADRELKRMLTSFKSEEMINNYLTDEGIKWHFNPASAPHFGGLWEASVKSMKFHRR